jgi:hypothetical protein
LGLKEYKVYIEVAGQKVLDRSRIKETDLLIAISGCYKAKSPKIVIAHAILQGGAYVDPPFRISLTKLD